MDNPKTLETLDRQDTGRRRQTKHKNTNTTQKYRDYLIKYGYCNRMSSLSIR